MREFISFPKSGRSWLRYALVQLGVEQEIAFHHDGFEYNDGTKPSLDFNIDARRDRYRDRRAIVYLKRDPRDVIVSLYYQVTGRFKDFFDYQGTISEFIRDPYFGAQNLRGFQAMWDTLCAEKIALPVTYEACHADMNAVLVNILAHYGIDRSPAEIAEAVTKSDFKEMQMLERRGQFDSPWLQPRNGAPKIRQGQVGGFHWALCPADIDFLNRIFDLENESVTE